MDEINFYLDDFLKRCELLFYSSGYTGLSFGIKDLTKKFVEEYVIKERKITQLADIFRNAVVNHFSVESSSGRRVWTWETKDGDEIRTDIKNYLVNIYR